MKSKLTVVALAATVAVGAFAPAASATTVCHSAAKQLTVCAAADLGQEGTTVAPSAVVGCSGPTIRCESTPVAVGKTGFEANPAYPQPEYDLESIGVGSEGGTVGTVYVNGTGVDVTHENFCTGSDQFCTFGG